MPTVKLKRRDGSVCYWCGVEGWIRKCGKCGFYTCETCRKPHNSDYFKFGEPRFIGVFEEDSSNGD